MVHFSKVSDVTFGVKDLKPMRIDKQCSTSL